MIESPPLDPHLGQEVFFAGEPLNQAQAAMLLIHGRGATAQSILTLADELAAPGFAFLAPQATAYTWYPERFLVPQAQNEPWLTTALATVQRLLGQIQAAGIPASRAILLGFSQGACLALEYAARNPQRYGGLVGLSGGLIGTDQEIEAHRVLQPGSGLAGTPVFLGCSDIDPHIPLKRARRSAEILQMLGGAVTLQLYPGMGHTIHPNELDSVSQMMRSIL